MIFSKTIKMELYKNKDKKDNFKSSKRKKFSQKGKPHKANSGFLGKTLQARGE